jgi:hypothetical protein
MPRGGMCEAKTFRHLEFVGLVAGGVHRAVHHPGSPAQTPYFGAILPAKLISVNAA